jgi:hypothetical protein
MKFTGPGPMTSNCKSGQGSLWTVVSTEEKEPSTFEEDKDRSVNMSLLLFCVQIIIAARKPTKLWLIFAFAFYVRVVFSEQSENLEYPVRR